MIPSPPEHSKAPPPPEAHLEGKGQATVPLSGLGEQPAFKLATSVIANIIIISLVGLASILLMLFGTFEGKTSRLISTLIVFAAFTFGSHWMSKSKSGVMVAQVGNIYMLALSLVLIWGSLNTQDPYSSEGEIVFNTIMVVLIAQLAILVTQRLTGVAAHAPQRVVAMVAKCAVGAMVATGILFTLPFGLFDLMEFGGVYMKISIATTLFAALAISIMSILLWSINSTRKKMQAGLPSSPTVSNPVGPQAQPRVPADGGHLAVSQPSVFPPTGTQPWPVFPNGQPVSARADGSPDFAALLEAAKYLLASAPEK